MKVAAIKCLNEVVIFEPNTEEQIILMRVNEHMELSRNNFDSWILSYCLESIEVTKLPIDFFSLLHIIIYVHVNFNRMKNLRLPFELNVGVCWEICLRII